MGKGIAIQTKTARKVRHRHRHRHRHQDCKFARSFVIRHHSQKEIQYEAFKVCSAFQQSVPQVTFVGTATARSWSQTSQGKAQPWTAVNEVRLQVQVLQQRLLQQALIRPPASGH